LYCDEELCGKEAAKPVETLNSYMIYAMTEKSKCK